MKQIRKTFAVRNVDKEIIPKAINTDVVLSVIRTHIYQKSRQKLENLVLLDKNSTLRKEKLNHYF